VFVPREHDETVMAQKARVRVILPIVSSTRGNKRTEFINRDFNAAINTRQCGVLKTRPEELTRANFVRQPIRFDVYNERMRLIAGGRSKEIRRHLVAGITIPSMVVECFYFTEYKRKLHST